MYDVILADPPWQYKHSRSKRRAIERQYPTMTLEDIRQLPVGTLANRNAVLYLWATAPKLADAMGVMARWGFDYTTCGIWDKRRTPTDLGVGYWFRGVHELLLIGKRRDFSPPPESERIASVQCEPRSSTHSAKPAWTHIMIERSFPGTSKIELFARDRRAGWDSWGDEIVDGDVVLLPDTTQGLRRFARRSHFPVVLPQPTTCLGAA